MPSAPWWLCKIFSFGQWQGSSSGLPAFPSVSYRKAFAYKSVERKVTLRACPHQLVYSRIRSKTSLNLSYPRAAYLPPPPIHPLALALSGSQNDRGPWPAQTGHHSSGQPELVHQAGAIRKMQLSSCQWQMGLILLKGKDQFFYSCIKRLQYAASL